MRSPFILISLKRFIRKIQFIYTEFLSCIRFFPIFFCYRLKRFTILGWHSEKK